jgi:hypothetical protein
MLGDKKIYNPWLKSVCHGECYRTCPPGILRAEFYLVGIRVRHSLANFMALVTQDGI